jgi:16S rRNA G1207 methylase RsmC
MGQYPRILMNPPFANGQDVAHIKHAIKFLAAPGFDPHMMGDKGGRLVAICANGPRQQAELRPLATTWEELPEGTFAGQHTNVRTVLLTIDA